MSGASGAALTRRFLQQMGDHEGWETHLVISSGAARTIETELQCPMSDITALATVVHDERDIGASIASGTFRTAGMVVIPCSMKSLAGIAHGYSDNLLLRAADVTMKEQRKLVLVARETPLGRIHLDNMARLASQGVRIMPPMMTFYTRPRTIEDMIDHLVGKVLAEFGIEGRNFHRWHDGDAKPSAGH
jgi:polyprenyl P-hydroxybenzoate/phenylacrylic acid decarboxylase-like protein